MKKQILLTAILLVLSVSCNNIDEIVIQYKLETYLSEELDVFTSDRPGFPGGIAFQVLSQNGNYFVHNGLGEQVTNRIHLRAASNTKTFTSAGIMLLLQRGQLSLTDYITDPVPGTNMPYIPDTPDYDIPYKDEITIWQLLTHRAGVYDIVNDKIPDNATADVPYKGHYYTEYMLEQDEYHPFSMDELIGVVATCGLSYTPPGTEYKYSNQGYSLLGIIIENISGMSYREFMMQEFVLPLGLTDTSFPDRGDEVGIPEPFAPGYYWSIAESTDVTLSNMSANIAEGNMITSPRDLSRFIKMLLTGTAGIGAELVNKYMMDCKPTADIGTGGYGAGLFYINNLGYGHNGAHDGYLSYMIYDPVLDFGIVIFTNCWDVSEGLNSLSEQMKMLHRISYGIKSIVLFDYP